MKVLKPLCAIALTSVMSASAQADTLYGLYVDANYWQTNTDTNISGNALANVINNVDAKLNFSDKGQVMVSAHVEHGVPFIPNARISYTSLNSKKKNFETNLSSLDAIAYYELLDNIVSIDAGVGAKQLFNNAENSSNILDQFGSLSEQVKSVTDSKGKTLGVAYLSAGGSLPFTGFSAKASATYGIGKDINTLDAVAELKYTLLDVALMDISTKTGYRIFNIENKDVANLKVNNKQSFKGPFVGAEIHF